MRQRCRSPCASYLETPFGPVLSVRRVDTVDPALALIDGHPLGNGAVAFTRDDDGARTSVDKIEVGLLETYVFILAPVADHSFGGWTGFLFGDHAVHGPEGAWARRHPRPGARIEERVSPHRAY